MDFAAQVAGRIEELGVISDEPGRLTRLLASPAMRRANRLTGSWMRQAGMTVRQDAIGNLIGHFPGSGAKTLLLGSHLDTVRNAGKFDGPLGVLLAIACVEQIHHQGRKLPFAIDVIGFADEEGVRYQTAYLGSRAVTGDLASHELDRTDADGITLAEAIRQFGDPLVRLDSCRMKPGNLICYVEAHIEQGPVLQEKDHAVGIVSAIAGQTRARIDFQGTAGHAGTVPMNLRHDALCAASEFILEVEKHARQVPGLVATVGHVTVGPNAANVIPGSVHLTLDVRHQEDGLRREAELVFRVFLHDIARRRQLHGSWQRVQETASVPCSPDLSALLRQAALRHQPEVIALPSGAGHDAAILARLTPAAMLFVRCRDGLSHHPDESVRRKDIRVALAVLSDFISLLAGQHERV